TAPTRCTSAPSPNENCVAGSRQPTTDASGCTRGRKSPCGAPRTGLLGDGVVDGVEQREDLGEAGDLEDLADARLGAHQVELSVVGPHPLEGADEDAETGRV